MDYTPTPLLNQLIEEKIIVLDEEEYCGIVSDGLSVFMGNAGNEAQIERYLKDHPNPTDW